MRDPERIDPTLTALKRVWEEHPDLRLGQLVVVAVKPKESCPEVFYVEDDAFLKSLLDYERKGSASK